MTLEYYFLKNLKKPSTTKMSVSQISRESRSFLNKQEVYGTTLTAKDQKTRMSLLLQY